MSGERRDGKDNGEKWRDGNKKKRRRGELGESEVDRREPENPATKWISKSKV